MDSASSGVKSKSAIKAEEIYLGKSGKVYGPYQRAEFDEIFASGKIANYTWIWDWKAKSWKPIEMPPPPIEGSESTSAGKSNSMNWRSVDAICFNRFNLISGKLESVTESGCQLVSKQTHGGVHFQLQSSAELGLVDLNSNKNTSAKVTVAKIEYRDQAMIYRLIWDSVPRFT